MLHQPNRLASIIYMIRMGDVFDWILLVNATTPCSEHYGITHSRLLLSMDHAHGRARTRLQPSGTNHARILDANWGLGEYSSINYRERERIKG